MCDGNLRALIIVSFLEIKRQHLFSLLNTFLNLPLYLITAGAIVLRVMISRKNGKPAKRHNFSNDSGSNLRTNWLICYYRRLRFLHAAFLIAGVAQLVEQLICNHQVGGSSPFTGSSKYGGFVNWTTTIITIPT